MMKAIIKSIRIEKLFGMYNYNLDLFNEHIKPSQLTLIYGENGCGKTTIMQLLFHLLSPEKTKGHRTYISKVIFKKYEVELLNGDVLSVNRKFATDGEYRITCSPLGGKGFGYTFNNEQNQNVAKSNQKLNYAKFINYLERLNVNIYVMNDSRQLVADGGAKSVKWIVEGGMIGLSQEVQHSDRGMSSLSYSVSMFEKSIKDEALNQFNIGAISANAIYRNIVEDLNKHKSEGVSVEGGEDTRGLLLELSKVAPELEKYGLMPDINIPQLLSAWEGTGEENRSVLNKILAPYVNGLIARTEALESLKAQIHYFLYYINRFFNDKIVSFHISTGLTIRSYLGHLLTPDMLSSGEKHLLLMLTTIVGTRDKTGVFIIDEPEISLNVRWQRSLVKSFIDCTRNNAPQLLISTHSMEIISQYYEKVVHLDVEGQQREGSYAMEVK